MYIGSRLGKALNVIDVKSKDLVDNFSISQQYVSNLKKAEKFNDTIAKIADFYDINLNWLFSGKGDMFVNNTQTNNLQGANIGGSGVDNSTGSNYTFNQNSNPSSIPDFIIEDLEILFKRAKDNKDSLIDAMDDFISAQKKLYR